MMPIKYRILKNELHGEIEKLRRVQVETIKAQADWGHLTEVEGMLEIRATASILTDIYQGAEKSFQRVARTTEEGLPSAQTGILTF